MENGKNGKKREREDSELVRCVITRETERRDTERERVKEMVLTRAPLDSDEIHVLHAAT